MKTISRIRFLLILMGLVYLSGCIPLNQSPRKSVGEFPDTIGVGAEKKATDTITESMQTVTQATLGEEIVLLPGVPDQQEYELEEPVFGGDVYVYEAGKKNPRSIVLIHGWGENGSRDWALLIPELVEKYHVIAFDLPGFANSSRQNQLYSPPRYAEFVHWIVGRFASGPIILAGHSMGGAIALQYAAKYQQHLEKLILVDVAGILHRSVIEQNSARLRPKSDSLLSLLPDKALAEINRLIGKAIVSAERIQLPVDRLLASAKFRQDVLEGDPGKIAALALVQEDFGPVIDKIETPTHLIWGVNDTVAPARTAKLLAARLASADLEWIQGAAHVPMTQQPAAFNLAFERALSRPPVPENHVMRQPATSLKVNNGYCNNEEGTVFTGDYNRIEVTDCQHVKFIDVRATSIRLIRSSAEMENSRIDGEGIGLSMENSRLTATAISINADVGVMADGSRLDMAGATISGKSCAVRSKTASTVLFSVSHINSPLSSGYVHAVYRVTPDRPL